MFVENVLVVTDVSCWCSSVKRFCGYGSFVITHG